MLANFQQLLLNAKDGLAWLVHGITVTPAMLGIAAVAATVLWLATMRHGDVEPPRCSNHELPN